MAGQQAYNIGQIIYILSNKSQSVVPAIVAEEDFRKIRKLDGVHEVMNYKLCIGPKDRQRIVELSRIDGEVFESLEEIRTTLVNRLTEFVDGVIKTTQTNISNWYGVTSENQVLDGTNSNMNNGEKFDPEQLINSVNGNTPLQNQTKLQHPLLNQSQVGIGSQGNLRENIRAMVSDEAESFEGSGLQMVILPDGTKVPVKINE